MSEWWAHRVPPICLPGVSIFNRVLGALPPWKKKHDRIQIHSWVKIVAAIILLFGVDSPFTAKCKCQVEHGFRAQPTQPHPYPSSFFLSLSLSPIDHRAQKQARLCGAVGDRLWRIIHVAALCLLLFLFSGHRWKRLIDSYHLRHRPYQWEQTSWASASHFPPKKRKSTSLAAASVVNS